MGIEHLWHHGWSRVEGVMPLQPTVGVCEDLDVNPSLMVFAGVRLLKRAALAII